MRRSERFPADAAELVLTDLFVEQLAELTVWRREDVLVGLVRLCGDPGGKHPLRAPLAGWNTLEVLGGHQRVVYRATVVDSVGLIEALCLGPRTDSEVYDMAIGLRDAGVLTDDELTELWDALAILDVVAEQVGLDGWDFRPEPAPEGMRRAAVASGLLGEEIAALLSRDEIEAAMAAGWGPEGPDPMAALVAALERARSRAEPLGPGEAAAILSARSGERCGVLLPRAQRPCVRRTGHPGPHRSG
ncbi:MAG: hypothetical protein WD010_07025 [Nitriliruptor sp.]